MECSSGKWIVQSLVDPEMTLQMVHGELPIGSKEWVVMKNYASCNEEEGNSLILTLTQCYPDKFTCGSGHCISLEDRCNIELECRDETDEYNCNLILVGDHYARENLPISENVKTCIIYINVSVSAFPKISTKESKFSADFYLNLRWYDLHINLRDLNHDYHLNMLSKKDEEVVWMPKITFTNSLSALAPVDSLTGFFLREKDPLEEDISLANEGSLQE